MFPYNHTPALQEGISATDILCSPVIPALSKQQLWLSSKAAHTFIHWSIYLVVPLANFLKGYLYFKKQNKQQNHSDLRCSFIRTFLYFIYNSMICDSGFSGRAEEDAYP